MEQNGNNSRIFCILRPIKMEIDFPLLFLAFPMKCCLSVSQAILDVMVNLQFTLVETLWKTFWRFSQSQTGDATLAV